MRSPVRLSRGGDRAERQRLGLPGGGPRFVLSPLGVFDFDESGDMQVRSLHAGVSADQLTLLRERVDVERTLA